MAIKHIFKIPTFVVPGGDLLTTIKPTLKQVSEFYGFNLNECELFDTKKHDVKNMPKDADFYIIEPKDIKQMYPDEFNSSESDSPSDDDFTSGMHDEF